MSFELFFVVPHDRTPPTPSKLESIISKIPHVEKQKTEEGSRFLWYYEYLNPETGVVCSFRCMNPEGEVRGGRDTGLSYTLPLVCPTFFAREALPLVEQVAKPLGMTVVAPRGELMEADAGALQSIWAEANKRTIETMGTTGDQMPPYIPRERLDEMWRYMHMRHQMDTRYQAKGIYVPRVIFIRNKLQRKQVFLAAMWTEVSPAVIPNVDAFVIGKPRKGLFGLLPSGEVDPVVVKAEPLMKILEPHLRQADRPIPHRLVEDVGRIKGALMKAMGQTLAPLFSTFETVSPEELIDIDVG